jgi:predicted nucleic acid-binding protein
VILIDSNIFMYAAGAEHPHKAPSLAFLRRVARGELDAAVDAEVLQELLHRYRAIGHWAEGRGVYDQARRIVGVVIPITAEALDSARRLLDRHERLTARDALHAAVVEHHGLEGIVSYDRDFDAVEGLNRSEPGASC